MIQGMQKTVKFQKEFIGKLKSENTVPFGKTPSIEFGKPIKLPLLKRRKYKQKITQISETEDCISARSSNQNNSHSLLRIELKEQINFKTKDKEANTPSNLNLTIIYEKQDKIIPFSSKHNGQFFTFKQKEFNKLPKLFKQKYKKFGKYQLKQNQKQLIVDRVERIKSERNFIKSLSKDDLNIHTQELRSIEEKYKILKTLGNGSSAVVKQGLNHSNQQVAIKIYQKTKLQQIDKKKNAFRQIKIMKKLDHPNLIKLIEIIETPITVSLTYQINIVMEKVQNYSLYTHLKKKPDNKLSENQAKHYFRQITNGIVYLHQKNIVHRDLKLENILITKNKEVTILEQIKIVDFGFSIQIREKEMKMLSFCGTPHYMAPEIIQRKGYLGKPVDIWASGIILYKLLTSSFPFKGIDDKILYSKISKGVFNIPNYLSKVACNLLVSLLRLQASQRPTANEILKSSWLNDSDSKFQR